MRLIDTHCHLEMEEFYGDLGAVIERADKNGVEKIITVGCSVEESHKSLALAQKHESVYAAIGLHPGGLTKKIENILDDLEKIEELAKEEKVVAIGEIGLEYRGLESDDDSKQKQKEIFLRQLSMAERLKKPVMIHCRGAYEDLIKILAGYKNEGGIISGVVHCFSGRLSQAKKLLELGLHLSFTGIITYARDYDTVIKETLLEKILLETDAPYLSPVPYRGQRNEPAYILEIAKRIAEIKGVSFEEAAEKTTENAQSLFNI
jgi:TatD DNase family protein